MISVIIPVYKVEQYLDNCLQSVLAQTYTDWECILVDDGSPDASGEICDQWHAKDGRFICIHQKNQGVSTARNNGLKQAKGEYIVFIDSDDWVGPNYLINLRNAINEEDVDIAVSGVKNINKNEDYVSSIDVTIQMRLSDSDIFLDNIDLLYGPTSKIYRKSLICKYSIEFPAGLSLGEDMIFNFSYLYHSTKLRFVPIVDYYYRQQDNGLCNMYRVNLFDCLLDIWNFRVDTLKEKGIWNDNIYKYFSIKLWGSVYDSLFTKIPLSYSEIRRILSKLDTNVLREFKNDFPCAAWIKFAILYKLTAPIYLITHLTHLK